MLIAIIGLINFEKVEKTVDPHKVEQLKGALTILKKARNTQAHTHLKGVTHSINAPSITISHFETVYDGLRDFDTVLRKVIN